LYRKGRKETKVPFIRFARVLITEPRERIDVT